MSDLRGSFLKSGYVHVRGVVDPATVEALREEIEEIYCRVGPAFGGGPRRMLTTHEVLQKPSLYRLPLIDKVVTTLREVLGRDYVMLGDMAVHRNLFGVGGNGHWHTDSVAERGQGYLLRRDYRFVNCGIYLQENTHEYGGGISVLPGGHRYWLRTFIESLDHRIQDHLTLRAIQRRAVMLPIQPGDFVAFHSRLPHAATVPEQISIRSASGTLHVAQMPRPELNKYVFYFTATNKREFAQCYLRSSERQAAREATPSYVQDFYFTDYLRLRFPSSYPEAFVREARARRVHVETLPADRARHWDAAYSEQVARRTSQP